MFKNIILITCLPLFISVPPVSATTKENLVMQPIKITNSKQLVNQMIPQIEMMIQDPISTMDMKPWQEDVIKKSLIQITSAYCC